VFSTSFFGALQIHDIHVVGAHLLLDGQPDWNRSVSLTEI
jgi:hypothetical protein